MPKRIIAILLSLILFLIGGISGYVFSDTKKTEVSTYDILYKNIDNLSVTEKTNLYASKLKAETAPAEIKYLMSKIMPTVNNDIKNNMLAQYVNHVQYYMSTYSDFISIYQTIMKNISTTVNFQEAASADKISDKVLKTIITEIYASDMKIVMPPSYSDAAPYILVDYTKIESQYKGTINQATKDYISFKEVAQKGELADANGKYDITKVGNYIIQANEFITKYPQYPLVSDVIYSYILGSKMYLGTYNVSAAFIPDAPTIAKYKIFAEKNPSTPITNALKEIIVIYDKGEKIPMDKINEWNKSLDGLLGDQTQAQAQGQGAITNPTTTNTPKTTTSAQQK